jgi:hypothetical protein
MNGCVSGNAAGREQSNHVPKKMGDKDFHEEGGESIRMVQRRNMEALNEYFVMTVNAL